MEENAIIFDIGTGYTKIGYGGNFLPTFVFETQLNQKISAKEGHVIDFYVGQKKDLDYDSINFIDKGLVSNWTSMELFLEECFYGILKCNPEGLGILLTEVPFNPPEARENLAEIMFETFEIGKLYIGVQAILSLITRLGTEKNAKGMSGVVIDSGDGLTQIIPITDGFLNLRGIKSIPIAGKNITQSILSILRERNANFSGCNGYEIAKIIKENYSYISENPMKEISYPASKYCITKNILGNEFEIGYERFLGPEMLFNPRLVSGISNNYNDSLAYSLDQTINFCPIDLRSELYENIFLSGGSTKFPGFNNRLEADLREVHKLKEKDYKSIKIISDSKQPYAAWYGGSVFSTTPFFTTSAISMAQYLENGSSIFRKSHTSII